MLQTALNLVTIFISKTEWENVATVPGTLLDPYRVTIDPLSKDGKLAFFFYLFLRSSQSLEIVSKIQSTFPSDVSPDTLSIYNPSLATLFSHFVEAVCNICFPFTSNPTELAYIVCARWPGFVAPIVEEWKILGSDGGSYSPPTEDVRIRLLRLFNPSLTNAVEHLYPRLVERSEWAALHSLPEGSYLTQPQGLQLPLQTQSSTSDVKRGKEPKLTTLAMFIIVASFLASYNPAKTDYRMFGKGIDEKSRKRKKGGGTRKTKTTTVSKVGPYFSLQGIRG